MFSHEGVTRPDRKNQILAGYLALVAGLVNSSGLVLFGAFTSHVTGNVGRLADELASGRGSVPFVALMVLAFFAGALAASMALETNALPRRPRVYGALLGCEAACLLLVVAVSSLCSAPATEPKSLLLCAAMGMQNSLVTRLSGAVVRTTHLTGVVTDLGIEAARWFRYWRARVGLRANVRTTVGDADPAEPAVGKAVLLMTILCAFVLGSLGGALAAIHAGAYALLVPSLLLLCGSIVAFRSHRELHLRED